MEYGGKENLDHRAFWYCQCPTNTPRGVKKSTVEWHLASLPESRLRVLLSLADTLSAAPLSLAEQPPGAAHWDFSGALQLCPAVPSAASAAAPGWPELRAQVNVRPVSLREAWGQNRGNSAGRNTWKSQYTENQLKSFSFQSGRVQRVFFSNCGASVSEVGTLVVIDWSEGWSEILNFGKIRAFWAILFRVFFLFLSVMSDEPFSVDRDVWVVLTWRNL